MSVLGPGRRVWVGVFTRASELISNFTREKLALRHTHVLALMRAGDDVAGAALAVCPGPADVCGWACSRVPGPVNCIQVSRVKNGSGGMCRDVTHTSSGSYVSHVRGDGLDDGGDEGLNGAGGDDGVAGAVL
eukprot:247828-Rhodomonas_salina.1